MVYVHVPVHSVTSICIIQTTFYLNFQCNGKPMPWSHVEKLYKEDTRAGLATTGLRLVPKLKFEHIYLSSFSKMRVDLAAQVCTVHVHVHVERERDTESIKLIIHVQYQSKKTHRSCTTIFLHHSTGL